MTYTELAAAGIDVPPSAYDQLARFVTALLFENTKLNLTAARDEASAWTVHVCDSLALLPLIRTRQPRNLIDIGTGGGVPGLPLACVFNDLEVTLLDATQKKIAAVERIIAAVGLENTRAIAGRSEHLAHDAKFREQFDAITARAVGKLPELIEYSAGFVRPGGVAWYFKTAAAADAEQAAATRAAAACGLRFATAHAYRVPDHGDRVILTYEKHAALKADLPRTPDRVARKPL